MTTSTSITDTSPDTTPGADLQTIIDGYFTCWNTTDNSARLAAVEATWTAEARSVDPLADVTGHAELTGMFAGFHELYVGHSFRQRGGVDEHHDIARWGWEMIDSNGTVVLDGIDVAMITEGRIAYLVGFFGSDL
jgi:SnoaL-like domain